MFVAIYFENVLQFCGIWKKYFLRSLTLGVKGAKTRFFKMWPKSMHDQKFEKIFRPRPEDGLYGSNEPKKCEIRPVVSSIVHFKVFKSYFIYITSRFPCSKNMSWLVTLSIGKSSTGISPTGGMATRNWHKKIRHNILFSLASFQCPPINLNFPSSLSPWLQSQLTICLQNVQF